ncbi:FAD-binding dehydrogenase [Citricoccus sp. NPDC055426]|uniref:FAD-binding dehydrogenase n=1 Tax=Citricoccus sp. NPDC055426 TaxID=3155536 RepID=UPI0034401BFB
MTQPPGRHAEHHTDHHADAVVVGHGLAGLVAATELLAAGRRVVLVDQERPEDLGGQAWWSFGGLFLVDSPEQRRLRVRDSVEQAWADWQATAGFDRPEDELPRQWARAYVEFAAGEKRSWLRQRGHRIFPVVGWAERRPDPGAHPGAPGNSVPRFHITWGTGPGIVESFAGEVAQAAFYGRLTMLHRHRVESVDTSGGAVAGVSGTVLAPDAGPRGSSSNRTPAGTFRIQAPTVLIATGGIGADHGAVRASWPARLGTTPGRMLSGVPAYVDGSGLRAAQAAGGAVINPDRMWHYTEGIANHSPVWPDHGIRILPGPSSLWLDATGRRLPDPLWPGFNTLDTLTGLRRGPGGGRDHRAPADHSWFILNRRIIGKEFALSGSEQNPDLTGRSIREVVGRARQDVPGPVQVFLDHGEDFLQAPTLRQLVAAMNALVGEDLLDAEAVAAVVRARDRGVAAPAGDAQLDAVRTARGYLGDRLVRATAPHRLEDPAAGPLIAVRLRVLTRKTLGGLHTDLGSRVLDTSGTPVPGLYAAGEAAGFGGGGMHGYRALEGTFLGGCLFSGRAAGRQMAADLAD